MSTSNRWTITSLHLPAAPFRRSAITRGDLVAVLPKLLRVEGSISIAYAERKLMSPQVRAFVDWIIERAPAALSSPSAANVAAVPHPA